MYFTEANLFRFAAYVSPPLTSLPVTTNDVTRGFDPDPRRAVEFFAHHRRLQPSPPTPAAGFSGHPSLVHRDSRRGSVPDTCPNGSAGSPWPPDDYWVYSSAPCGATVTSSCEARRRYHVTTPSPVDVSDLGVKDERLTNTSSGVVAYAGKSIVII